MRRKPACSSSGEHRREARSAMRDHVAHPFLEAAELAAIAHRAPHLLRELGHDLLVHGEQAPRGSAAPPRCAPQAARRATPPAPSVPPRPRPRSLVGVGRRASSRPSMGEMQTMSVMAAVDRLAAGLIEFRCQSASDDLEIARQLPIGDRLAEFALLPFAGRGVVVDEGIAEQGAAGRRGLEALRRLPQGARQRALRRISTA